MEKRNSFAMKCGYRDRAVSEVIGSILLVAIVVTALSIVGVVLWSQPPPQKLPALDAVISEDTGNEWIHIYHGGGDSISADNIKILVDGYDYKTSFTKAEVSGWSSWTTGESLDYKYSDTYPGTTAPSLVQIIYTNAGTSTVLAVANFARPGSSGSTSMATGSTITATAGTGGLISPSGLVSISSGSSQSFTITPNAGYHILDVTVDGVSQGTIASYTFTNVVSDHTIAASFAINTYTIAASAGANGIISPSGATTVNYGATPTYTITPNTGYHVTDVKVDSVSVGAVTSYTFPGVTAGHTISATFAINTYTITPSVSGGGGTIDPATAQTVNYGDNQGFAFTPNSGYVISDVLVDGESQGSIPGYMFTNVQAPHTISATFVSTSQLSAQFTYDKSWSWSWPWGWNVYFTDASTGNPNSWSWNFGDGHTSTSQNPVHKYNDWNGHYDVTLTVTNAAGATSHVTTRINL